MAPSSPLQGLFGAGMGAAWSSSAIDANASSIQQQQKVQAWEKLDAPLFDVTFMLNWHVMPYHAPIYLAQRKGLFEAHGIRVAIVQPSDPSDVAELVGCGKAELGLKPMLHTMAAKARGDKVQSIGTLLDEPFTGLVYLRGSGVTQELASLRGKRIGFPVGRISKLQVDELCRYYGLEEGQYQAIRCGMNISQALIRGHVDAGIGLENVQMVELAEWLATQGRPKDDVQMLRIDELAGLGCCCFCTVLYIGSEEFIRNDPEKVRRFMRACKQATDFVIAEPTKAYAEFMELFPHLDTPTGKQIFERSFAYLSESMANNARDWQKVTAYGKRLGMLPAGFEPNYTNAFLDWPLPDFLAQGDGSHRQQLMAANQRRCAIEGGCHRVPE